MRIPIRLQLALLVLFCSLMSLMVLALAVWFQNYDFIRGIRLSGLSLTASLKAAELSATLLLYQSQVQSVTTRVLVQTALQRYNNGNTTNENWNRTQSDLQGALSNGNLLVQAVIFPGWDTGNATSLSGLVNVTAANLSGTMQLPYNHSDGSPVYLGEPGIGYPNVLYPNITYGPNATRQSATAYYQGEELDPYSMLLLGPLLINDSYALVSATVAVINNTSRADILGWLTVLINAVNIYDMRNSPEGLGNTGEVLLIGPDTVDNMYPVNVSQVPLLEAEALPVRFVLPPHNSLTAKGRHGLRNTSDTAGIPFSMGAYPAVVSAFRQVNNAVNNAGAYISTRNEEGKEVSVGYATMATRFVDWVLVVEQGHDEVVAPIDHLRDVVLICVFSVVGLLMVIMLPIAHYSVTPIRNLRTATSKTVEPYLPDDASGYSSSYGNVLSTADEDAPSPDPVEARKEGFFGLAGWGRSKENRPSNTSRSLRRRRTFRIPRRVPERRHWITDELTDLTRTFNEMSDELVMQYERLEERVKERTAELERSKKAAEAANQSKTLFIANISHELKTPLNGILGLTTVCMAEDDPQKVRSTLGTIYKSGDLLLHLLTDLLTFSKNEVGHQLSIDESEFRLSDLSTQLMPTFDKQARENQVDLKILYLGTNDAYGDTSELSADKLYGPGGTGRVRDMCLWGDKNRILQVLMNFVSNSLKFTPAHGSVTVRIRCLGLKENMIGRMGSERKSSVNSRKSKASSGKRVRMSDASLSPQKANGELFTGDSEKIIPPSSPPEDAKLSINIGGGMAQIAKIVERRRSMSPPPLNTKDLLFEFEVEDTGPGIPEDQQKKIFDPFVQGDLGLSKKYGGTGLGLSICVQLAELMGGSISLDSKVGVGSKFAMSIPLRYVSERSASTASSIRRGSKASSLVGGQTLHDQSEPTLHRQSGSISSISSISDENANLSQIAEIPRIVGFTAPYVAKEPTPDSTQTKISQMKQAENEAARKGKKVRVLVAEDNKVNQEVVLRMLKLEDVYDVTIAKDGQEAFDKVRESMEGSERFDLVFMDVQMPNLDGIQSTRLIREMGFSAPIVALTAFAEKSNEDECMASGMDYFLAKPIRRPALKQVLKKYCATIPEEENEGSTASIPRVNKLKHAKPADKSDSSPSRTVNGIKGPEVQVVDSGDVSPMS